MGDDPDYVARLVEGDDAEWVVRLGPSVSSKDLKDWLDESPEIEVLHVRHEAGAHLNMRHVKKVAEARGIKVISDDH